MTLELPWPPKELSPNARTHWARKNKIAQRYKGECRLLTIHARMQVPEGPLVLDIEFVPPNKQRRDDDNCLAAFKSGRDGIAAALSIDDSRFSTRFRLADDPVKGGMVRVRLYAEANEKTTAGELACE
ncbi:endodeoxyribonuclease RusA [uncultured Stutzerimonas sp.]|uniref:endodeoxyribonuclease RusA n=1 Tax=uncultured Stutzerimonas sp. TaxID=2901168 RepID=UPI0032B201EA|tara:strand:- start:880 stop:1263 length:384 start_codon:yes stop_codon:yes gene_type:complete